MFLELEESVEVDLIDLIDFYRYLICGDGGFGVGGSGRGELDRFLI